MSKKYESLSENPLVKGWLSSYSAFNTRNSHLKRFGHLIETIQVTPEYIIEQVKSGNGKELKMKVKAYCMDLVNQGKTATASLTLSSFRSFLLSQELQMIWTRQDMITIVATETDRRVPTKEEIYRITDGLDADTQLSKENVAKYKAMIWTAYESGVRPSALLSLKVKHVDISIDPPIPIKVTPDIDSKIRKPLARIGFYWAFIGKEAQQAVKQYLTYRHDLTPESPLFTNEIHKRIIYKTWLGVVHRVAKYGGFKRAEFTPHSFRHGFRKAIRPFVDDQVGTVLTGHTIKGAEDKYFDRKDGGYLAHEYAKIDWTREKPAGDILLQQSKELSEQAQTLEELKKQVKQLQGYVIYNQVMIDAAGGYEKLQEVGLKAGLLATRKDGSIETTEKLRVELEKRSKRKS